MKILVIANSKPSIGSIESSMVKGFLDLSSEVDVIYPSSIFNFHNNRKLLVRLMLRLETLLKLREFSVFRKLSSISLDSYDFVLVIKGMSVTPLALKFIKEKGISLYGYNPDDPYNPESSNANIIQSLPLFDMHFTWSKSLVDKISKLERVNARYLPFAADLDLTFTNINEISNRSYKYPVSFIGNWDPERERQLNLVDSYSNLVLFGYNWGENLQSQKLLSCYSGKEIMAADLSDIVFASKINLNFLRVQNKNSNNMRTFEILAAGGMLLHEFSEEVASFFEEGVDIEFFRNKTELNEKIAYYLKNPGKAEILARNGNAKIISGKHSYQDRVRHILEWHNHGH